MPSPSQSTGVGIVASTQNGPVTRVMPFSISGLIHQYFFGRRLVVGDGLERDVRDNAANFLALLVLLAFVDEPAGRAAMLVLQLVPGKGGGQEPLPSQRQRHAAGVDR